MAHRELRGNIVVITGASSGFGKGSARKFAERGASVVLVARRAELLHDLARECAAPGRRALVIPADVTQEEDVAAVAERAATELGRIDIWVNNAGAGAIGPFEKIPLADHVKVIQTDLLGTLYGSYFALRQFRRQGAGTLINIASLVGKVPSPYFASYVAAKYGIVGLGASLLQELREEKVDTIHVCTVLPAAFDTPFFEHAAHYTGREAAPVPPTYDPKDVVEAIVSLAADPRDEVSVGAAAKVASLAHHLFPGVVEAIVARQTRKAEYEEARPGEESSGSLHEPMPTGTGVRGGGKK